MTEENHRESSDGIFRFGEYELDPKRGVLSRGGVPLKIQPQPSRVLELLLVRAPGLVTREELSDYVWGNRVNVDLDQSLNFCVRQIRLVLNDNASHPKFIDTLPKQGYRFIGDVVRHVAPASAMVVRSVPVAPAPLNGTVQEVPQRLTRRTFVWSAAAAALVGGGAWLVRSHRRASPAKAVTVVIPLPEGATNADPLQVIGPVAVAPDGSAIVIPLKTAGTACLYLRHLDSNRLIRLEGSEYSSSPFWSPDSQHIAFAAEGDKLKRMPAVGGSPVVLCDEAVDMRGGTWSRRGDILFGSAYGSVFHVSDSGGKATRVTQVDAAGGELSHWFPFFLPDGNRFLYTVMTDDPEKRGVYLESLDHRHAKRRLVVADGPFAIALDPEKKTYVLLSEQAGKIAAQTFDVNRAELWGPSHILLDRPGMLSVSDTGTLVIRKFGQDTSRLVWRDRTGRELGVLGPPGDYEGVHLSPDDRFVAITRLEPFGAHPRTWIAPLPDGLLEPFSDSNHAVNPMWSEDSRTVYYTDDRRGVLLRRSVFPRGTEDVVMEMGLARRTHVGGISPSGRYAVAEIIANWAHAETVWTEMKGGSKGEPQWHSMGAPGSQGMLPSFSPDGRWLAFSSNPTGRYRARPHRPAGI
jgi:DNA-binding winged helix-turn-helix (wHTH) protein